MDPFQVFLQTHFLVLQLAPASCCCPCFEHPSNLSFKWIRLQFLQRNDGYHWILYGHWIAEFSGIYRYFSKVNINVWRLGKCFRDTKLKELVMNELFKSCVTFVLCDWFECVVQHRVPLSKFIKNVFTKGQEWNWIIEKCDDFFPLPSSSVNTFFHLQ